jgi:hypothetical protein
LAAQITTAGSDDIIVITRATRKATTVASATPFPTTDVIGDVKRAADKRQRHGRRWNRRRTDDDDDDDDEQTTPGDVIIAGHKTAGGCPSNDGGRIEGGEP